MATSVNTYSSSELDKSKAFPIPIPAFDDRSDFMAPNGRPNSMVTLEESDFELSHSSLSGQPTILRNYSPLNSRSSDNRKRYSYYGNSSFSLGLGTSPGGDAPLLESLLDPNVGVDLPKPRGNRANASKRSSWYAGAPLSLGKGSSFSSFQNLPTPIPTAKDDLTLPPPPTIPFNRSVSPALSQTGSLAHSSHSSVSSNASLNSIQMPPSFSNNPSRSSSPVLSVNPTIPRSISPSPYQPFNFQSVTVKDGGPSSRSSRPNQRRGHKYKHSSVSMNFFKEDVRAPLTIPASLPIPNMSECKQSMSREQTIRMIWGIFHLFVAFLIYTTESPFSAISALAHLLFYDAMGALLCAVVDILGNFDVWKRSSIHLPFGLERAEVLAGFALSISLIFMGGDIMSHSIQDIIQTFYSGHEGHDHAHHHHVSDSAPHWGKILSRVSLAIIATIISAVGLDNHARISRAMRNSGPSAHSAFSSLPWILSNPSHFITVTFCAVILVFPIASEGTRIVIDTILTPCIAGSMCYIGWILAKSLGGMLVMSFPGENRIDQVKEEVSKLPSVISVNNISVWQVHHSAWLACMKVVMKGTEAGEQEVRERASELIKSIMTENSEPESLKPFSKMKLNQSYNSIRWETTIDIQRIQG